MIRKEASQMVALIKRMLFLENSMFWVIPKFLVAAMADIVPVMTRVLVPGQEALILNLKFI